MNKEVNPAFLVTLAVIAIVTVIGLFINQFVTIEKRIRNLEIRPVAIMPVEQITATPSATTIPVKQTTKASQSGIVK